MWPPKITEPELKLNHIIFGSGSVIFRFGPVILRFRTGHRTGLSNTNTNHVTDLAARLNAIGVTLKDEDIVDVLIFNLHHTWSSIASSLSTATGELKLNDVISALDDEEARRIQDPFDETTYLARSTRPRSRTPNRASKCYVCDKPGHIARDCPRRTGNTGNSGTVNSAVTPDDDAPVTNPNGVTPTFGTVW